MESKIPLPTDNIFKFYAMFSLLLFVFAIGASLYVNRSTNEQVVSFFVDLETLKQEKTPSQTQLLRKAILERQLEIARSDKAFFHWSLIALAALATLGLIYGFGKWHKEVQPISDEMAKVQLDIAKLQLAKLRAEAGNNDA